MDIDIEHDLSICLPVSDWKNPVAKLLTSFYEISELIGLQIILVDLSPDTRPENISNLFPELILYDNNGGDFSPSTFNNGLRLAKGRYFALWDVSVTPDQTCLEKLVRFMDMNPDAGICGPSIKIAKDSAQLSCGRFPLLCPMIFTCRLPGRPPANPDNLPQEVDWVSRPVMIIRREVFHDTGLFDEGFKRDLFDIDLCRRAKKHGWHIWHLPDAETSVSVPSATGSLDKLHGGDVIRLFLKKYSPTKSIH